MPSLAVTLVLFCVKSEGDATVFVPFFLSFFLSFFLFLSIWTFSSFIVRPVSAVSFVSVCVCVCVFLCVSVCVCVCVCVCVKESEWWQGVRGSVNMSACNK